MTTTENTSPQGGATPPTGPVTGTNASTGVTPEKAALSLDDAMKRIADLEHALGNSKEAEGRVGKKLSAYEKAEQERLAAEKAAKDAELGELDLTKKQLSELQAKYDAEVAQYKQELISAKVQLVAYSKGVIDTELASMAIQKSLELDENGMPTNIEKALDNLIKNKPYLAPKQEQAQQTQEQPANPAQTATQQKPPATPPMNPGRTQISPPSALPPGQITRLTDVFRRQ